VSLPQTGVQDWAVLQQEAHRAHPIFQEDPVFSNSLPRSRFNVYAAELLQNMRTNVNNEIAAVAAKAKRLECASPRRPPSQQTAY
jgi:hypothetical protein